MRRARDVLLRGSFDAALAPDSVTLDHDERRRRRCRFVTDAGESILLDLVQPARLRDGDGLALDDGGVIRVVARPERLLEISAGEAGLARLAWHIGNRHLPMQIVEDRLLIREDHVIADMVKLLGGVARPCEAPFDPEPGAYGGHGHHAHDHEGA